MEKQSKLSSINWNEWSQEAFLAARQERKPVLLTLTATWCHWCHVMEETSYSDPRVIDLVNSRFIPISVDVDRRPDISRRYNQGGFPSVAILDEQANLIVGRTYAPPDQMIRFLEQETTDGLALTSTADISSFKDSSEPVQTLVGDVQDTASSNVLQRLQELYDPDFGGLGLEPKQPPWESLRFLMALYSRSGDKTLLKMIHTTLDGMRQGLYDQKDQGFFRYSVARDWRVPHYEKMVVTNANLAMLYLEAYQLTKHTEYKQVAQGTLAYLLGPLYNRTKGVFYASQDAWEDYYRLPWKDRETAVKPPIDSTVYTGWNALAADAMIHAYSVLGEPSYLKVGAGVLDRLWNDCWNSEQGLGHLWAEPLQHPLVLEDHVYFLRALLSLYQSTGRREQLNRATEVAKWVQEQFGAPDGGFFDTTQGVETWDKGLPREKPVLENSWLAEALIIIADLNGDPDYQALARDTLENFRGIVPGKTYLGSEKSRLMEEDEERLFLPAGSAWARAWDMLSREPVRLVVVGERSHPATRSLLKAALKVCVPHRIVEPLDPMYDGERIASLGFPPGNVPSLYACMGTICLAPITMSREVTRLLTGQPWTKLWNTGP